MSPDDEPNDPSPSVLPDAPSPRVQGRFAYASGAQPLTGYTIKRGVGMGGFGEIYFAVSDAGKEVALKLIQRHLDVELRGIRQCLNLKHPNLVSVFDVRRDDAGQWWVVMEFVAGRTLHDAIAEYPRGMPVAEALYWFRGIAAGVACLHDHGIVHRDLKPANIFSDEGYVKVGDYGLSKFISCSRRSGNTESIGTVHYMAPEVANGRYGKEIDIYALGILLYEMLTGRVPFDGESVGEILMKHLTAAPDLKPLAEPYRSVVGRAMEKDPAKRFASVQEMLDALDGVPAPPIVMARVVEDKRAKRSAYDESEEPIARRVRQFVGQLRQKWDDSTLPPLAKWFLLLAAAIILAVTAEVWMAFLIGFGMLYAVYYAVRTLIRLFMPEPQLARTVAHPIAVARGVPMRGPATPALVVKPPRDRVRELFGSLFLSALAAGVSCVVATMMVYYGDSPPRPEQIAWLGSISLLGVWSVLAVSKPWEGTIGEPMVRRFIMFTVGLGVGAASWAIADWLFVDLFARERLAAAHPAWVQLFSHMGAFGVLFGLVRWWRQTDPLRPTRLSLWSLTVSIVAAGILASAFGALETWLVMVAGVMSISVQIASPWSRRP